MVVRTLPLRLGLSRSPIGTTFRKPMERQSVSSKAICSIGYDRLTQTMEIEFRSGRIYQYREVEPSVYEWLMKSSDKGGLFNRLIRDRYSESDVSPEPEPQDLLAALRSSLEHVEEE